LQHRAQERRLGGGGGGGFSVSFGDTIISCIIIWLGLKGYKIQDMALVGKFMV